MKVIVYCNICTSELQELYNGDTSKTVEMECDGSLYVNKEHKIETQGYICKKCKNQVTISLHFD